MLGFKEFVKVYENEEKTEISCNLNEGRFIKDVPNDVAIKTTNFLWSKYYDPGKWRDPTMSISEKPSKVKLRDYVECFINTLIKSGEFSSAVKKWREKDFKGVENISAMGTAYWVVMLMRELGVSTSKPEEEARQRYHWDPKGLFPEDPYIKKKGDIFRFEEEVTRYVENLLKK